MGNVYFIQAQHRVKIGFTNDVVARIAQLQTGSAHPLQLLAILPNVSITVERRLHRFFAEYRVQGEWFQLTGGLASLIRHVQAGARPITVEDLLYYTSLNKKRVPKTEEEIQKRAELGRACAEVRRALQQPGSWATKRAAFLMRGEPFSKAIDAIEHRYLTQPKQPQ